MRRRLLDHGCDSVLLVEDEPDILTLLGDLFEEEGLATTRAASAEAALELLRGGLAPDLVLLDLLLPGMRGDELLRILREDPAWRGIPVAVMTGDRRGFDRLRRLGASEIVEKPFSLERLNEVVAGLCAKRTGT
jgi:CheY-like chemotaxis protein